jgi:hypothetical protein
MFLAFDGGCLVISPGWPQSFEGGQVLFKELWFPNIDEIRCGQIITIYEQRGPISQASISIH